MLLVAERNRLVQARGSRESAPGLPRTPPQSKAFASRPDSLTVHSGAPGATPGPRTGAGLGLGAGLPEAPPSCPGALLPGPRRRSSPVPAAAGAGPGAGLGQRGLGHRGGGPGRLPASTNRTPTPARRPGRRPKPGPRAASPWKSPVSATTVVNCLSWSSALSILCRFTGEPDMARR